MRKEFLTCVSWSLSTQCECLPVSEALACEIGGKHSEALVHFLRWSQPQWGRGGLQGGLSRTGAGVPERKEEKKGFRSGQQGLGELWSQRQWNGIGTDRTFITCPFICSNIVNSDELTSPSWVFTWITLYSLKMLGENTNVICVLEIVKLGLREIIHIVFLRTHTYRCIPEPGLETSSFQLRCCPLFRLCV